jgi:hypothetical protein
VLPVPSQLCQSGSGGKSLTPAGQEEPDSQYRSGGPLLGAVVPSGLICKSSHPPGEPVKLALHLQERSGHAC